jgi:AraC-like DNA-binding protein
VQRSENGCSLLEFGPLGVEHKTRAEFEQGLNRLGFSSALRTHLRAPLNALRTVRAEDIEGVLALLERVAASIADELLRVSSSARVLEPKAVAAARRYAEHHIGDKISLVDVARHVALSPDHFSRLFRRKAGVSFGEYMNRCRVANAQRMLGESTQRVGEISFACGFDSVPHFNRVFRRVTGSVGARIARTSRPLQLERSKDPRGKPRGIRPNQSGAAGVADPGIFRNRPQRGRLHPSRSKLQRIRPKEIE